MDDKLNKIHQYLLSQNIDNLPNDYDGFVSLMEDDEKAGKVHSYLLSQNIENVDTDFNAFKDYVGIKKKVSPIESAAKGETVFQELGLPSEEPITPKLPYRSPQEPTKEVKYDDTLPESITPTSVIKSNESKGKFLSKKQEELSNKISTDFEKEAQKLKSDYEKRLGQEGANKKQLEDEYKVRVDDLKLRKEKEAESEWDKLTDPDNYEYLAPEDVKGLNKEIDKVLSQQMPFDKREEALGAIRDNFLSKVSILPTDIQNTLRGEINEVFARKTLFDEQGNISSYGWKKEASDKLNNIQGSKNRVITDFTSKYPDFQERTYALPGGMPQTQGFSPSIEAEADADKRKQFQEDYQQYKKDIQLLGIAEEKLGNIMQTGDGSASFADAFRMGGRDLVAAVSSAGWSDVAKALENTALSEKVQKGEELSEGERALFDTYGIFDAYQQGLEGAGFKLGNVFTQSLPIMESIASLNVMGLLGGAGTATLKQLAKKEGIKKLLTKEGAKLMGKEALTLGGAMAKGAPLTPMSWQRQQQGLAGQKVLNEKGEWAIDKATVEGKAEATLKGLATGGTELGSEILGGYMGEFGTLLRRIPGIKNIKLPKAVGQLAKTAGIQGAPTEIAEEFINMLWQAPIGDQPLSEITLQDIWDTIWTTAGLTTILGSAAIPSGVMNTIQRSKNYNIIQEVGRDRIAAIRDAITNKDQGAFNNAIEELKKSDMSEGQIKDVLSYAKTLATEVVVKDNIPETTDKGTAVTEVGALEVPQVVADQKAQEDATKAEQLKAIEDLKESEKTDEPVGTITPIETKEGRDWYNIVNEEGQRDTFSVPEGSPQDVVKAKSEKLVKPQEEVGQTVQDDVQVNYLTDNKPELKWLEEDLPTKKPTKGTTVDVSELSGEVRIKPIPQKIKIKTEDDALINVVAKDELRPVMEGVFYDAENQVKVGSDANVLTVIPTKITGKSRVINPKTKQEVVDVKYPNYMSVIPDNSRIVEVDANTLLSDVSGAERANMFVDNGWGKGVGISAKIVYDGKEIWFDPAKLKKGLLALLESGTTKIRLELPETYNRAIVIRDVNNNKKLSLVMPIEVKANPLTKTVLNTQTTTDPIIIQEQIDKLTTKGTWGENYHREQLEKAKKANDEYDIKYEEGKLAEEINAKNKTIAELRGRLNPQTQPAQSKESTITDKKVEALPLELTTRDLSEKSVSELDNLIDQLEEGTKTLVETNDIERLEKANELIGAIIDIRNEKKAIEDKQTPVQKAEEFTELEQKGEIEQAPLKIKEEEIKAKIADNLDNLMSAIGGIKNVTGDQRAKIVSELKDLAKNIADLTALKGEQLWAEVRKYLNEKKITVPDDIIKEAQTGKKEAPTAPITEDQGKVPPPPQKPVKTQEKGAEGEKRTGFEKRETEKGRKGSIEQRKDEIGQIVKRIIDDNPHFYKETTRPEEITKAQEFISSFASFGNALKNLLGKTKNLDDLLMRHVARQVMMQKLGEDLRDAMKSGNKQLQDAIANDIVNLEDITQKELRVAATTLSMTMWQFLTPEATVFMVNRVVNEANRTRLGFEAQQAEEFINKWNEEIPESVKRLLSENPELRDFLSKVKAVADKAPQTKRTTKAKAKDIATKVRSLKSTNWGLTFADPIGATAILDGALEVTARTIETTGNILQAINDGVSEIRKSKWYQSLTRVKQKEVELTYNKKVRKEVDFDATEYIEGQSWYAKATEDVQTELDKELTKEKKEAQRLKKEADQRLKDLIFDTIASHWLVEKTDGKSLTDRLVDDVGLTRKEAEQIAKISEEAVRRDSQKIFDETLGEKIPNKNTKTSAFDKFFKLIKRGALTNENYYEVFAKDYKLQKGLTQEQKNELQRLSMNAHLMAPYGYLGDLAFNEFAQYMAKITEQDSWIERQTRLMIAANYARMLSGVTTSKVNLTSAGINLIIRPFFGVANPVKWVKTAMLLVQGKSKEAHLQNPLAALAYAMQAYRIGAEIGGTTAINIVKNGNIKEASKYLESVNNIGGQNIPELEKNTFGVGKRFKPWDALKFKVFGKTFLGDLNLWNAMKYSGRVLLAEDAAMFNMPFALEMAMAARKEAILSGQFKSMKDLKNKILNTIAGNNLTEEQAKNIEAQLEEQVQMLRAVGIEPTPMQIKQRRFELNRSLLDISQEQIDESTQLARGEIFTDKQRGGMFSIIGDALGGLFGKSLWIKVASMPKIPFTGVLGRIADMGIDTTPVYGLARAKGWSPTGILARLRQWARTGQFKDFMTSPAKAGLFKSAQMGVKGSALYERQVARHNLGLYTLGILAAVFLSDDDDEKDKDGNPFIDITGGLLYHEWNEKEKHYIGAYTAKIGRFKFRYLNYPIFNTPFAIIGNYKDAQKAGKVTDDFIARMSLLARSWFYSLGLVKDTWLAKGINDIVEMIGGLFTMMGGEERRKILKDEELVEIEPRVQRQLENLRDDYTGLPIKYLSPLKSNLLQQAIKFTTPESRLKGTGVQLWAYNVGLQWWNDKRTDIFGQEVKTLPGDQGTAWPRDTDKRWADYWKYNVHVQDITPREKLVIKGVPQALEWEQYIERKGMVQNLFKDRWDEYFANNSEEVLEKRAETYKVEPRSGNKTNMVDLDVRDIWSKTKQDVHKYMFVWDDHVKENEKLFDFLLEESLLPDFYRPKIKTDSGEDMIIPFDRLLDLNNKVMENFIPMTTNFIDALSEKDLEMWKTRVVDKKTGETALENRIKLYWDRAKKRADRSWTVDPNEQ